MKLELKHIVGYLPYGLKYCNRNVGQYGLKKPLIGDINTMNVMGFIDGDTLSKPILRPLSDLTKDEHFELYMDLCEEMESISCEYLLESLIKKTKYAFNLNQLETLEDWMYKNHFDWKYNLIKNGLAIDINTFN